MRYPQRKGRIASCATSSSAPSRRRLSARWTCRRGLPAIRVSATRSRLHREKAYTEEDARRAAALLEPVDVREHADADGEPA